jgi:hypothetical protein
MSCICHNILLAKQVLSYNHIESSMTKMGRKDYPPLTPEQQKRWVQERTRTALIRSEIMRGAIRRVTEELGEKTCSYFPPDNCKLARTLSSCYPKPGQPPNILEFDKKELEADLILLDQLLENLTAERAKSFVV